ncbi:hypothetical protein [Magnetovibrio sp.]|uniref:hypothetical protein n=1 Tax=Magnetovibrio sp. TaxID=2024836 RepID=UPI002F9478D1
MIDVNQFRNKAVQPVLETLAGWNAAMNSPAAENLLVGTAVQESHLTYLAQLSGGPALGVMQIEPATHDDVWTNYLAYRNDLAQIVLELSAGNSRSADQLPWNMGYSIAIARLVFWRQSAPMPTDPNNLNALGQYWKQHYNTAGGAGTADEWVENYQKYVVAS